MATINLDTQPHKITITNTSSAVKAIQFYRNSAVINLKAGDAVVIKTETSAEEAYYLSLAVTGEITVVASDFAS